MQKVFTRFAKWASHWTGQPIAFLLAAGVILTWIISDTDQGLGARG